MFMLVIVLMIGPLLLGLWAQMRVKSTYALASRVPASAGASGAETARMILDSFGLRHVGVEAAQGFLSDHYDPKAKVLRLSPDVYQGRSVAALGIAAHEAGHAIQDATNYGPLVLRNGIVPLAAVGSQAGMFMLMIGAMLGGAAGVTGAYWLMIAGAVLFSAVVIFQIINLPVEFDASKRAKEILQQTGMVAPGPEAAAMNKVLSAAALTYVAATVGAIATLLYYLLLILGSRRE